MEFSLIQFFLKFLLATELSTHCHSRRLKDIVEQLTGDAATLSRLFSVFESPSGNGSIRKSNEKKIPDSYEYLGKENTRVLRISREGKYQKSICGQPATRMNCHGATCGKSKKCYYFFLLGL